MPKLKRYLRKDEPHPLEQVRDEKDRARIRFTLEAIERFIMCSCIRRGWTISALAGAVDSREALNLSHPSEICRTSCLRITLRARCTRTVHILRIRWSVLT